MLRDCTLIIKIFHRKSVDFTDKQFLNIINLNFNKNEHRSIALVLYARYVLFLHRWIRLELYFSEVFEFSKSDKN